MKNPVLLALASATPEHINEAYEELLKPFGVKSFATLLKEFEKRDNFMKERVALDEAVAKEAKLAEERKTVTETLNKAGVKTADGKALMPESAIVNAYIALSEEQRKQFVLEHLVSAPASDSKGSKLNETKEPGANVVKEIAERVKAIFPAPIKETSKA